MAILPAQNSFASFLIRHGWFHAYFLVPQQMEKGETVMFTPAQTLAQSKDGEFRLLFACTCVHWRRRESCDPSMM